ncbi:MAG: hypothetical protein KH828_08830 [Clostridiales bacterium]|nr:hypothetical protein [Clostridiales bacterium]
MDYQAFKMKLLELVQQAFGQKIRVSFEQIPKNNGIVMEGMIFTEEGEHASPVIYMQEYYEFWKRGITLEQLVEKILWSYEHYKPRVRTDRDFFRDYEKLKTHIYYKLVNREKNREELERIPWRKVLDLAMVFYCQVEDDEVPATVMIRNGHLRLWKITEEELVKNAVKYTCLSMPAEFLTMAQVAGIEEDMSEASGEEKMPMYILTNRQRQLGAGVILYPGIMEQARRILGNRFYILPSSIHECILVPGTDYYTQEELSQMVAQINKEHVDPREVLADHAYYYSEEDQKIHI